MAIKVKIPKVVSRLPSGGELLSDGTFRFKRAPTGPIQHCADLPKKKQKKPTLLGDKLVVVRVTREEMCAVHQFLFSTGKGGWYIPMSINQRLEPLLQGIARGYIMQL